MIAAVAVLLAVPVPAQAQTAPSPVDVSVGRGFLVPVPVLRTNLLRFTYTCPRNTLSISIDYELVQRTAGGVAREGRGQGVSREAEGLSGSLGSFTCDGTEQPFPAEFFLNSAVADGDPTFERGAALASVSLTVQRAGQRNDQAVTVTDERPVRILAAPLTGRRR